MSAGLEAVKRKLRTHASSAIAAGKAEAWRQAEIIASLARAFAPEEEGKLKASIRVVDANSVNLEDRLVMGAANGFSGAVVLAGDETTIVTNKRGAKFQNAKLHEGGTKNMPANPFLNPARRMRASAAKIAINRVMRNAWKGKG